MLVQIVYDVDPRVRRKAEALIAAGYVVDVLALRPPDGRKRYTINGVSVRTIPLGKKRGSLVRYAFEYLVFFVWAFVRVSAQMARRRYVIVDVNTLPDFLVFAPIVARWMGAKIVLDMHEITPEFYRSKYGIPEDSQFVRVLKYLERKSFDFADHVITINEPIQDLLIERGLARSKSSVVMNAVDEGRWSTIGRSRAANDAAQPSPFVMLYHGTLTRTYGLDLAIEAFALSQMEMPRAELWILGAGPEQLGLAALATRLGVGSKVRLFGQVPAKDIPAWLNKCDVGILPMRRDVFLDYAFPNKLPEFVIARKPVLTARLKAIRHYFSDRALAYFEPNDAADLAKQMLRVYRDPAVRDRLVSNAAEEYAPIRWELMRRRYLDLLDDLVAEAVGPRAAVGTTVPTP
jgi:glycosyltransferase involved in cell wall biosynthesis